MFKFHEMSIFFCLLFLYRDASSIEFFGNIISFFFFVRNVLLEPILELLARNCCLIEHLFLDNCSQGKTFTWWGFLYFFLTSLLKLNYLLLRLVDFDFRRDNISNHRIFCDQLPQDNFSNTPKF